MLQVVAERIKISDVRQAITDKNADMLKVTGLDSCSWEDKISDIRKTMGEKKVDMLVVTGLDSCLHCVTGRSWDE